MRRGSRATAAQAPVGSPTSVVGIGVNVAGSETKTANAFGAMNVIKHAERCPKSTLDKTTTTFTILSIASSVCDRIGMGLGWGLSAIGCGGIAFLTTTASINKQFDLASMKQDLGDMKQDLASMKTQMVSLEVQVARLETQIGFAKLSAQIAQNTPHGNRLQDFDGPINALQGKIDELQDIETGKINVLQGEINVMKRNIEAKKAAIAALEFKSTPLVSVHEHV